MEAKGAFSAAFQKIIPLARLPDLRSGTASRREKSKFTLIRLQPSKRQIVKLVTLLDLHLAPHLKPAFVGIPQTSISGMRENYAELLPKTFRFKTIGISSNGGVAGRAASSIGITEILCSDALRMLAERVTHTTLDRHPGRQIICYEDGDFSGPHNDHHPEQPHLRAGYVDAHLMISAPSVKSQLLVYERRRGLLNCVEELGYGIAIAIYRLPFWHHTTPLQVRVGTRNARRWLLLASYEIKRSSGASK